MMDRTASGWKCPRCGSTTDDGVMPVRTAECNCAGVDAFHEHLKTQGTNPSGPRLDGFTLIGPDGREVAR